MTRVKGSKQYSVKVVPHRPGLTVVIVAGCIITLLAAIATSFYVGRDLGRAQLSLLKQQVQQLQHQLSENERGLQRARQQVANLTLGAEVDRKAGEDVRQQIKALKTEIAALEQDNTFYRNLMSPSKNRSGLTIGALELLSTTDERRFQYRLVVQQLATRHEVLTGSLTFSVVGRQVGEPVRLHLKDISREVSSENIKLRFRYFQTLEGTLRLPAEFEPERVELVAKSTGKNAAVVEKKYGWLVQET